MIPNSSLINSPIYWFMFMITFQRSHQPSEEWRLRLQHQQIGLHMYDKTINSSNNPKSTYIIFLQFHVIRLEPQQNISIKMCKYCKNVCRYTQPWYWYFLNLSSVCDTRHIVHQRHREGEIHSSMLPSVLMVWLRNTPDI